MGNGPVLVSFPLQPSQPAQASRLAEDSPFKNGHVQSVALICTWLGRGTQSTFLFDLGEGPAAS